MVLGTKDQPRERQLASTTKEEHDHLRVDLELGHTTVKAMIDSGAQGNFISPNLVNKLQVPWKWKDKPYRLKTVEGEYVEYGNGQVDMETAPLPTKICGKRHNLKLDITEISDHQLILGIPWLRASNPRVNWRTGQLQWDTPGSESVTEDRLRQGGSHSHDTKQKALTVYLIMKEPQSSPAETIPKEYQCDEPLGPKVFLLLR